MIMRSFEQVMGGVSRTIVPPLTYTWNQGSRIDLTSKDFLYRSTAAMSLSYTFLEHVRLRSQDSSVTRPGDMGTSLTKVNDLGTERLSTLAMLTHERYLCI